MVHSILSQVVSLKELCNLLLARDWNILVNVRSTIIGMHRVYTLLQNLQSYNECAFILIYPVHL